MRLTLFLTVVRLKGVVVRGVREVLFLKITWVTDGAGDFSTEFSPTFISTVPGPNFIYAITNRRNIFMNTSVVGADVQN